MKAVELKIRGMNCAHCVMSVKKELAAIRNLTVTDVKIGLAIVQYDDSSVTQQQLEDAIKKAGFILDTIV